MGKPSQCSEMEDGEKRWVVWWKVVRRLPDERGFLPRPLGVARAPPEPPARRGHCSYVACPSDTGPITGLRIPKNQPPRSFLPLGGGIAPDSGALPHPRKARWCSSPAVLSQPPLIFLSLRTRPFGTFLPVPDISCECTHTACALL